jgi:hypothetical protein
MSTAPDRPPASDRGLRLPARRVALAVLLALVLALPVAFFAWEAVTGVRISLTAEEPKVPAPVAPLPGPAPVALPTRRLEVRPVAGAGAAAPARAERAGPAPSPAPTHRAAPHPAASSPAPKPPPAVPPATQPAPEAVPPEASDGRKPAAPEQTADAGAAAPAPAPVAPPVEAVARAASAIEAAPGAAARAAAQIVLPKSARLVYESNGTVRLGGFGLHVHGRTTTRWQYADGHYQSDLSIDVVNFIQTSAGQFDPEVGLAPQRYTETRRKKKMFAADFDWSRRQVKFSDAPGDQPADPGAQDRLSIQFQLAVLRQVYPERFVRGGVVPVMMAGTRDLSHWTFTVAGDDTVDTGLGRLPALRIVSNRSSETGDESLEVWLCERLDWFPARIRMVDRNRNLFDFVLDEAAID